MFSIFLQIGITAITRNMDAIITISNTIDLRKTKAIDKLNGIIPASS
ncbi:MAG: hypothetical protein NC122_03010 [Faecalibacterium sp.]|nr:hypothetical protein [Ruminococcus sp.]MCM1485155.1 hypothetical protein [Faecalibacterium sp.]